MSRSFRTALAGLLVRRPAAALTVALALTALAAWPASRLGIRADLPSLLPEGSPAAEGYRLFLGTFGGVERVFVMVHLPDGALPDPGLLADAADALALALARSPEVRHVRSGWDEMDEEFVAKRLAARLPLLLDEHAIATLGSRLTDDALARRAREIRDAATGPTAMFLSRIAASDPLGIAADALGGVAAGSTLPFDPLTGALLSDDGRAALVLVTPARAEVDAEGGRALAVALADAYDATRRAVGEDLRFEALGGPLYALHDERALRQDLISILSLASVMIVATIVLAFEGVSIPAVSLAAVAIGQIWCAALVASIFGHVTAVGVGFAAILLGLGDDFTIHLGARVRERWRDGLAAANAVEAALVEVGPGIVAAALTTAAAFACLGAASFRPLREMGVVVALGVVLLLAATLLAGVPMLVLAARHWRPAVRRPVFGADRLVEVAVGAGSRHPRWVLAGGAAATALALLGTSRLALDMDLTRMRPANHPAARAERDLVRDFGVGLDTTTVIVKAGGFDEALDQAAAAAQVLRGVLPAGSEVTSPSDWIVAGARERRRLDALAPFRLADTAERLAVALDREGLDPGAFDSALDGMRAIGRGRAPDPVPAETWPDWIAEAVRVAPDGIAIAVRARLPRGAWPEGPPATVLAAIERVAPGAGVANAARLGAELKSVAIADLGRLGALALGVVLAIVLASYRGDLRATAITFVPVVLGTVWTAGLWGALGRPLDVFSVCVLPVMVGIGVDDGLHVLHLARRGGADIARATREAGYGVVLTNLTTSAGFASLAVSQVPALRNGGLLICAGNLFCLAATLVVLPALAGARSRT